MRGAGAVWEGGSFVSVKYVEALDFGKEHYLYIVIAIISIQLKDTGAL